MIVTYCNYFRRNTLLGIYSRRIPQTFSVSFFRERARERKRNKKREREKEGERRRKKERERERNRK